MRFRLILCAATLVVITGCASSKIVTSWEGAPVDSLIVAWGGPDRDYRLPDGGRELTYSHHRAHQGTSMYCDAVFRASPEGVITSATYSGNIGGCNRLLWDKTARE
jgi:hypothetical protein